jgi:hypothetical protein
MTYEPSNLIPRVTTNVPFPTRLNADFSTTRIEGAHNVPELPSRLAFDPDDFEQRKECEPLAAMRGFRPCVSNLQIAVLEERKPPVSWGVS